ncbi:hypothetical protein D918_03049 [Trichuris suis]|nr:hypothetical protein D918_03049 [Trichuris suis]
MRKEHFNFVHSIACKVKFHFTVFSLGAVLMSATYVFSFAKKFASNCSQKTDQITPKECLLMNPHLFIYPFADYVIMHTSLLSSVDCFWTVACQRRKALFSEKNFNWIFAAVGLAATASVISYTIDVLQRTKEKIQICCLNNLMTSETFIFCYYVVSVSVGLTSVILLIFSAAVYAICHRSEHDQIRYTQMRRYRVVFTQTALLVLLTFFSQTLPSIGGLTLLNNRAGDWFFQSIWLITITSYVMFAVHKAVKDYAVQRKIRLVFTSCAGSSSAQKRTNVVRAQTTKV